MPILPFRASSTKLVYMKQVLRLSLVGFLFLASCSWGNGAIKKRAILEAQSQFREVITKEAEAAIENNWLREGFVDYVEKHSEFDVEDLKVFGDNNAVALVSLKSIDPNQRKILAEIAGKVEKDKVRNFNFSNALRLISQQTGMSRENVKLPSYEIQLKKGNGDWTIVK
jgi:hypothetical protein